MQPEPLGEILRAEFGDLAVAEPPDDRARLVALPPTERLRAALEELIEEQRAPGLLARHRQALARAIERVRRDLADGERRDALAATRPPGCWCLGLGGRGERYLPPVGDLEPVSVYERYCDCPQGRAHRVDDDRRRQAAWAALIQRRLDRLWGEGRQHYRSLTLETYPVSQETAAALASLRAWRDSDGDEWLLVWGGVGTGKTALSLACARTLIERGQAVVFATVAGVLERIRATYDHERAQRDEVSEREVLRSLRECDVLFLDDVGAEAPTDWAVRTLWGLINDRYGASRRTALTTNLAPADLGGYLGERTLSRILERAAVVHLGGPDLRLRRY